jgi:hypothetical protein
MLTKTKPASLLVTLVDLASKEYTDECEWGPLRDYKTIRILSRKPLPSTIIKNLEKRNPGYVCVGINEHEFVGNDAEF